MFAVIQLGAQQFKVSEGDVIETMRMPDEKGKTVTLDKVLLIVDGDSVSVGQPFLSGAKVQAKVVDHTLDERKIAFKFRRRKDSRQKIGSRQKLTALSISKIETK